MFVTCKFLYILVPRISHNANNISVSSRMQHFRIQDKQYFSSPLVLQLGEKKPNTQNSPSSFKATLRIVSITGSCTLITSFLSRKEFIVLGSGALCKLGLQSRTIDARRYRYLAFTDIWEILIKKRDARVKLDAACCQRIAF